MAYKVKITGRNFIHGSNIFGSGGVYDVDAKTARTIIARGRGVLIEGELPTEEDEVYGASKKAQFLHMVRSYAGEVIEILREYSDNNENILTDGGEFEAGGQLSDPTPLIDPANLKMEADLTILENESSSTEGAAGESAAEVKVVDIPEDYPGIDVLTSAGITAVADIPTTKEELMKIEGMTPKLANQIGVKQSQGK